MNGPKHPLPLVLTNSVTWNLLKQPVRGGLAIFLEEVFHLEFSKKNKSLLTITMVTLEYELYSLL